jgi:hypothetical protein
LHQQSLDISIICRFLYNLNPSGKSNSSMFIDFNMVLIWS